MSSFAKKQLEKYGWKEGQGLGREGEGIKTFVKVERRAAGLQSGVGHSAGSGTSNDDMGLGNALKQLAKKDKKKKRAASASSSDDDESRETTAVDEKTSAADGPNNGASSSTAAEQSSKKKADKRARAVASDSSSSDSDDNGDITGWDDAKLFARCGGVRLSSRSGRHRVFDGKLGRIDKTN